jgi:hypothetical protein
MEKEKQGAKDEYREIFLCEQDHPTVEPVTCRHFIDFPRKTNAVRKRVRKGINVVNRRKCECVESQLKV